MTNQFSTKVSDMLSFSREEAVRLSNRRVAPEHLLLGMMRDKQSPLSGLLSRMDIDWNTIKAKLEERLRHNAAAPEGETAEAPTLDEQAGNILKLSVLEARLQHSQQVNVEHVILAILHDKTINGAKQVLEDNGINYDNAMKLSA